MSLFACMNCVCVENTACCNYWSLASNKKPVLCSACDPDIGKWHDVFEQRSAVGMFVDANGHLWGEAALVHLPPHATILGQVLPVAAPKLGEQEGGKG